MTQTYVDAGVLIAAVRGGSELSHVAYELINDPERVFVGSVFLRLEVLPKATYLRRQNEVTFYQSFFARIASWAHPGATLVDRAEQEAARNGLNALDALPIVAAQVLGADEFVTTEGPRKPIHRTTSVRVVAIPTRDES